MTDSTVNPSPDGNNSNTPLSAAAIGAVIALVRVCELYDAAVAHRAALRATVASLLFEEAAVPTDAEDSVLVDRSVVIAAAALADVDLVISRPLDPEAASPDRTSMLGEALVENVPGLRAVAEALQHRDERWDGSGSPDGLAEDQIPLVSRIVSASHAFIGNPATGYLPTTANALRRTDRLSSEALDPQLCEVLHTLDLDVVDITRSPSERLVELLDGLTPAQPSADVAAPPGAPGQIDLTDAGRGSTTATAMKSAVAAAGHTDELLSLFAESARGTLDAAEVVVLRLTPTELVETPLARATDKHEPSLSLQRLRDLAEFSTQAELRAGSTIERPAGDDLTTELVVPIIVGEESWGVLIASRRSSQPGFDTHDLSVLRHIATEAAEAVTSTTHWAQMERMALRDQLTGLANRHELYRVLDGIFERPTLERVDCALIMCDVDGLKIVNDTMGHQAGDRLLIDAAAALRGAVRDPKRTTICRIGGDEFCVVIDGGALLTAHDVSDTIERLFARSAGSGPPRSISCGIAFADETISTRSALLRAADENQYQTKRARKASREAMLERIATDTTAVIDRRAIRD